MVLTHLLMTLHCAGSLLVRHRRTVFASLFLTAAMNEVMYRGDLLNVCNASLSFFFIGVFNVSLSPSSVSVILGGGEMASGLEN